MHKKARYERAIADFNKAIEINLDDADAYNNRGEAYRHKGDYDQAIADFDKAIELNPDLAKAYNNRGFAYAGKGDNDRAIADFDKVIELNPDAEAYYNRGIIYLFLQQWEQARKDLQTAKDKGFDIIALFHNVFESIADFEQETEITLPPEIAKMLKKIKHYGKFKMNTPLKIFIIYSHKNRAEKDELKKSLAVMEQNNEIEVWHDNEMLAGDKWREKITNKLNESDILLYLTSVDSLPSKNCNEELAEALERGKRVIPIILEDCNWLANQLSEFEGATRQR